MTVPGTQHPLALLDIWPGDRIRVIGNTVPDDEEDYRGSLGTVSGIDPTEALPVFVIVDQAEEGFGAVQFTAKELEVVTPGPIGTYVAALRAQAEAKAGLPPLDREPSTWDHRRTYAPGEQVWVVRFNVWHPAVIVRTDFIDYIVRIPSLDQLITATSCMLRTRAALAQAGGEEASTPAQETAKPRTVCPHNPGGRLCGPEDGWACGIPACLVPAQAGGE